ncbi:MAG TPA: uracil-DNA glycosylase [Methanolinea sp.]|nr:MAG: Uracil DNA glycosylase superfamily protein [Methanoregulaceae archaeon PtaB.Bin009]OPY38087.1 MAG: Uracil DNA glycosylase superfamily protein [Methanoregulaceae archaeon PtaU1.Bin066]HII75650.1 uracil-DNA glycosylase [Methanolinea sp.]HNQ29277.1 uracil-DNA glycosylase [Methanolinea sp.]
MPNDNGGSPVLAMATLAGEIASCRKCPLCASRTKTVPGEGPVPCRVMLVGEGPGRKEDETGKPFVGRAGAILSGLLEEIGLSREEVFITSVVKCRPPKNRSPKRDEIAACMPYLGLQIAHLSPEVLVPMGQVAAKAILEHFGLPFPSYREVRGREYGVPCNAGDRELVIIPVYHPAVITHNPPARSALEEDFQRLKTVLRASR